MPLQNQSWQILDQARDVTVTRCPSLLITSSLSSEGEKLLTPETDDGIDTDRGGRFIEDASVPNSGGDEIVGEVEAMAAWISDGVKSRFVRDKRYASPNSPAVWILCIN